MVGERWTQDSKFKKGIQRSCDVYFYEVARKLGVDRLSETAKRFGLGKKVLNDFIEEDQELYLIKWKNLSDKIGI